MPKNYEFKNGKVKLTDTLTKEFTMGEINQKKKVLQDKIAMYEKSKTEADQAIAAINEELAMIDAALVASQL